MKPPTIPNPESTPRTLYVSRIVLTLPKVAICTQATMGVITTRINPEPYHFFSLN
jgi:hypothetical protein